MCCGPFGSSRVGKLAPPAAGYFLALSLGMLMTVARQDQVIDRWHLTTTEPTGRLRPAQARGEESEPQPFNNRKPLAQRDADLWF